MSASDAAWTAPDLTLAHALDRDQAAADTTRALGSVVAAADTALDLLRRVLCDPGSDALDDRLLRDVRAALHDR